MNLIAVSESLTRDLVRKEKLIRQGFRILPSIILTVLVIYWGAQASVFPAVTTLTTRHTLPYIPLNFKIASNVTNVFSERELLGGSGGVGLPQVDWTLEKYQELEDDNSLHVVDIVLEEITFVETYVSKGNWVYHATIIRVESPRWGGDWEWGYYHPTSGKIEGGELILERTAVKHEMADFLVWMLFPLFTFGISVGLASIFDNLVFKPYFRRLNNVVMNDDK